MTATTDMQAAMEALEHLEGVRQHAAAICALGHGDDTGTDAGHRLCGAAEIIRVATDAAESLLRGVGDGPMPEVVMIVGVEGESAPRAWQRRWWPFRRRP